MNIDAFSQARTVNIWWVVSEFCCGYFWSVCSVWERIEEQCWEFQEYQWRQKKTTSQVRVCWWVWGCTDQSAGNWNRLVLSLTDHDQYDIQLGTDQIYTPASDDGSRHTDSDTGSNVLAWHVVCVKRWDRLQEQDNVKRKSLQGNRSSWQCCQTTGNIQALEANVS